MVLYLDRALELTFPILIIVRVYKAWYNDPALAVDDKVSLLLLIYAFANIDYPAVLNREARVS